MLVRATVCETFQTGVSPSGTRVQVIDGSVTLDGRAPVRSTADITLNGIRQWPLFQDSLLAPYGNEIYIERGIQYSDDLVEYVGLGYFRIEGPDQSIPVWNPIRVTLVDRMQAIIEGRLLQPVQFETGTTFGVVVETLIWEIYPDATIEWDDGSDLATLTRSIMVEEDRYGFLNDAITSRGKIWYWDHRGILVIKSPPSATDVVYTLTHAANGTLVAMDRTLTRVGAYNAVVATGEGADNLEPVSAVAVDNNPNSPTYFYGRFGKVPQFYTSPFLESIGQCETAARNLLNKDLGLPYSINFGTIANPALEPYDVVKIKYSHYEAPQTHILDTLTIPLTESGALEATSRLQHIVLAEAL